MIKLLIAAALVIVTGSAMAQSPKPLNPPPAAKDSLPKTVTYSFEAAELKAFTGSISEALPLILDYPANNRDKAATAFIVMQHLKQVIEYINEKQKAN